MQEKLKNYARLAVKKGVNLQPGQNVLISSDLKTADFARLLMEVAYEEGAGNVSIRWSDEISTKTHFLKAPEEAFDEFPDWRVVQETYYLDKDFAKIHITSANPFAMKGVDSNRIIRFQKASMEPLKEIRERGFNNETSWVIVGVPSPEWAQLVFADCENAEDKLWEAILKVTRADLEDPIAAWDEHINNLKKHCAILNNYQFKSLKYKNSKGTDFTIGLPNNHCWSSAYEKNQKGVNFVANIPSEEVFVTPHLATAEGVVYSTMPLNYQGTLIEDLVLTFKEGKVIDVKAKTGAELIKETIALDEGAARLGEVALVAHDSPISNANILFYNTLFDENASCHLAIGKGFANLVEGSEGKNVEEQKELGINHSMIHIDFMIGSADMNIIGITNSGEEIEIFTNGNWVI